MHHMRRKSLAYRSLRELRGLKRDIEILIREIERGPTRAIDIATEFDGSTHRVAKLVETRSNEKSGSATRSQYIYCSDDRCPECPHGPFLFEYRETKHRATVKFVGFPFVGMAVVEKAMEDGKKLGLKNNLESG